MHSSRNPYQSGAVETAGPAQLVLMLYDGALAAVARAGADTAATARPELVNRELLRAQDIITELYVTLDRERGGEIAANLASLYEFCLDRLVQANLRKDLALLDGVTPVLAGLREAWEQACCQASPAA
jgi:flagellar protein FliS